MTKTASRTMMVSAAAGLIAVMGAMASAEAKKVVYVQKIKVVSGPKYIYKWHRFDQPYFVYSGGGCGYYWWKWKNTGNPFWKAKYFSCIY